MINLIKVYQKCELIGINGIPSELIKLFVNRTFYEILKSDSPVLDQCLALAKTLKGHLSIEQQRQLRIIPSTINALILQLNHELHSFRPYPNKPRKAAKIFFLQNLEGLLADANMEGKKLSEKIEAADKQTQTKFPQQNIWAGFFSNRVEKLVDALALVDSQTPNYHMKAANG